MSKSPILAWHFTGPMLRDGSPVPPIGAPLRHKGKIIPCAAGLHASIDPFDALQFAPGAILHRVECSGHIIEHGGDKLACRQRTIIATVDAATLLRRFACDRAIEALHLEAITPPQIVAEYLRTADVKLRSGARSAAWSAADSAEDSAAWSAAWSAADSAAWSGAWSAAWSAARADFNARVHAAFGIEEG